MLFYGDNKYSLYDYAADKYIPIHEYFTIRQPKKVLMLQYIYGKPGIIILDGNLLHVCIATENPIIKYRTINIPYMDKIDDIINAGNSKNIYCIGEDKNKSVTIYSVNIYCSNDNVVTDVESGITILDVMCYKIINSNHIVFLFNDEQVMDVNMSSYSFDQIVMSDKYSLVNKKYEDIFHVTENNVVYKTDMTSIGIDKDAIIDTTMGEKKKHISFINTIYIENNKIYCQSIHSDGSRINNIFSNYNGYGCYIIPCVSGKQKINKKFAVLKPTDNTNYYSCTYSCTSHTYQYNYYKVITEVNYDMVKIHIFSNTIRVRCSVTNYWINGDMFIIDDKCYYKKWNVGVYHFLGTKYQDVIRSTIMCNKCLGALRMPKYLLYIIFDHVINLIVE